MKKFLALLVSVMLLITALPLAVLADEQVVTRTLFSIGNRPQNEFTD